MTNRSAGIPRDPDTFDVRASLLRLYNSARREWRLVLLTCAVVLTLVTAYVLFWPPIYTAEATLMSERDSDSIRDSFYVGWNVFRKDDSRTEVELFVGPPVLKEVVDRLHLKYDDVYHPISSHLAYLWQSSALGKLYRRIKDWISPPEADAPTPEEQDRARTLLDMRAGITVESVGESNLGKLTVRGPSRRVADIANTIIDVYLAQRIERHEAEAKRSYDTLSEDVASTGKALHDIEEQRLAFTQKHNLSFDAQKEALEASRLSALETSIATSRANIASAEASLAVVEAALAEEPSTRTTITTYEINALREAAKAKRLELQTNLIFARNRYREDSPEIQEINANIASLDAMIGETSEKVAKATSEGLNAVRQELLGRQHALQVEIAGARAGLATSEATAAALRARIAELPALATTLRQIDRDRGGIQDKYAALVLKQAQAEVSLTGVRSSMPSIRVEDYATRPDNKSWPRIIYLYPLALMLGLFLGLAMALLKSLVSGRIWREQLENGRGSARYLGSAGVAMHERPFAVVRGDRASSRT